MIICSTGSNRHTTCIFYLKLEGNSKLLILMMISRLLVKIQWVIQINVCPYLVLIRLMHSHRNSE